MALTAQSVIQSLVAPVIIISACGLLCLALYNRLTAIVSRARAFNKERYDLHIKLEMIDSDEQHDSGRSEITARLEMLSSQVAQVLERAQLIRKALQYLLISILFMLGCSLATGLSVIPNTAQVFFWIAMVCYATGICTMGYGIYKAFTELHFALMPAVIECINADMEDKVNETEDVSSGTAK